MHCAACLDRALADVDRGLGRHNLAIRNEGQAHVLEGGLTVNASAVTAICWRCGLPTWWTTAANRSETSELVSDC